MGPIGKGPLLLLTKRATDFDGKLLTVTAIYSALNIRDAGLNERIGQALMKGPYQRLNRLRRDPHDESTDCWLHEAGFAWLLDSDLVRTARGLDTAGWFNASGWNMTARPYIVMKRRFG